MKKVLVIYHREDNDGVCSAAIVGSLLCTTGLYGTVYQPEDIKYYGVNYADLAADWNELVEWTRKPTEKKPRMAKWEDYGEVFMVDISFNDPAAMNHMYETFGDHFHWCDHHAPIINLSKECDFGKTKGIRLTTQSALMNTWEYLTDKEPSDWLQVLSDYDSWAWTKLPRYEHDSGESLMAFNIGFTRSSNLKVQWYVDWIMEYINGTGKHDEIAQKAWRYGEIVYKLDKERTERAINSHGDTNWNIKPNNQDATLRRSVCLITTDRFNSQSFKMFRGTYITNAIVFKLEPKTDSVVLSLYNVNDDDEFDCGKFCKDYYNGGGHKGAAGATLTRERFMEAFINKQI